MNKLIEEMRPLLIAEAGSTRYGYDREGSDKDFLVLTRDINTVIRDEQAKEVYFCYGWQEFLRFFENPVALGGLTNAQAGASSILGYIEENRGRIAYANPMVTLMCGIEYALINEGSPYPQKKKLTVRTAFVLQHMADGSADPFNLSEQEKAAVLAAKDGSMRDVERAELIKSVCTSGFYRKMLAQKAYPCVAKELELIFKGVK